MVGETLEPLEPLASPVPSVRVYLAGGIALRGANGATVGEHDITGRQARLLLVRLAAIHEAVPHVELADDLWGPDWPPAWDVALRALVSKLRALLVRVGAPGSLVSGSGSYALHLPAGAWLDLDAAASGIHRAETALADGNLSDAAGWALAARAISSRPLLPGEEADWLERLRRHLAVIRLRSLEVLAEVWIAQGDPALAARDAAEAIDIDPYRESAHRLLIRSHLAAGDRGAAARALDTCRRVLADELGVTPSRGTTDLLDDALARSPHSSER
ncbi:MAG TPA: bacterial transcriptional activator domain-containing protein [Actinomycetota bacterium]|nr:bacterial transcriptional activator domain-containing protein [Actinomycetota bacterium]